MSKEITFLMVNPGDIIYYISMEKSVLKHKNEIKTSTVKDVKRLSFYDIEIVLENGMKFVGNSNNSIVRQVIYSEDARKYRNSIVEPFFCNIFSTNEKDVKDTVKMMVETSIEKLCDINVKVQEELIRLDTLRMYVDMLRVKKPEEVIVETVIC